MRLFLDPEQLRRAVLPVGETWPTADFYVSADLTRTSERRLQAGKLLGFEVLRSRFPYACLVSKSGRTQDAITDNMAHVHGTTRQMRHAASGLDGSRGCPSYARRRRESTCGSTLRGDPETHGAVPQAFCPCRLPAAAAAAAVDGDEKDAD